MRSPIRFGVWALVHGSRAALQDPEEPYDASWDRNRRLVQEAEALGFDSTLVAQHTINPHDGVSDQLEAWTASAGLAALTERIEIITAIKPYLYHPVVLAKMALQIEHISHGRAALNLVNAWNRPELEKAGIGFPDHDDRYRYGHEWITVVDRLMRGERVTHSGAHFQVQDYMLRPADPYRARPRIYIGGEFGAGAGAGRGPGRCLVHQRPTPPGRGTPDRRCRLTPAAWRSPAVRAVGLRDRARDGWRGRGRAGPPVRACRQGRAGPGRPACQHRRAIGDGADHGPDAAGRQQRRHRRRAGRQLRPGRRTYRCLQRCWGSRPSCCNSSRSRPRCGGSPLK